MYVCYMCVFWKWFIDDLLLEDYGAKCHVQQYFSYIVAVSFIGRR